MVNNGQNYTYDEVPYPYLSHMQTHPDRFATLGTLLGMKPADVKQCRVLEIGCAAGSNLLPMAAVLPDSTFVGIDNSAVQIEQAQADANAIGMSNVTFQYKDILDINADFGQFDYIIAHGIYSWIPAVVQNKLLDICNHNLAPQGIAYVSYNTYPGWHTLDIIRNMMAYRTRNTTDPYEKSAQARQWISFMAHALKDRPETAYAAIFENYLSHRMTQTEDLDHLVLLHDELDINNTPLYFHQFIERAEQHGLQYLVEADFPTVMPNELSPEVVEHLGKTARNTIEMEQYFDFMRNRAFRCTLLCHAEIEVDRRLSIQSLRKFYVGSSAQLVEMDAESDAKGITTFQGNDGIQFSTEHALTKAAFHYLLNIAPERVSFDQLVRQAALRLKLTQVTDEDATVLAANLLGAFSHSMSLIGFFTFTPRMTTVVSEYPLATPLARLQSQQRPYVTNLLQARVNLDNFSRLVLTKLDGQNDFAALLDFLVELAKDGKITSLSDEQIANTPDEMRASIAKELDITLRMFAVLAVLVA